jgi:hypothetical protein
LKLFGMGTFWLVDIPAHENFVSVDVSAWGLFGTRTFWHKVISAKGHFGTGIFWHGNILALGHVGTGTFWHRDISAKCTFRQRHQNVHV